MFFFCHEKMETIAEKLINVASHSRESIPITITGRINDKDGVFVERLEEAIMLDNDANYHVYLNDFTSWSNVPNVNTGNNMFHYDFKPFGAARNPEAKPIEPIMFPISTQSVDTYNDFLENMFLKRQHFTIDPAAKLEDPNPKKIFPVRLTYDLTVMRVIMHVSKGTTVTFKEDSWYKELGFKKEKMDYEDRSLGVRAKIGVYEEGIYMAPYNADIVKSLNILVKTNLSLDWRFKGKKTNILYNVINNMPPGAMISERPNPVKRVVLSNKNFHEIELKFETEDGMPVDFNGEEFILTIIIERM